MPKYTYLYNFTAADVAHLSQMNYPDAIRHKISAAQSHLAQLLEDPYDQRDYHHITDVAKAIKFNISLLDELKG